MKTAIKIIFLSLILIFCFQYFGGKKRLYYNKRYDLFIKVTELESGVGEVRLGKELVSLNSCIRFNYQGDDFPILFMIPRMIQCMYMILIITYQIYPVVISYCIM